jgi:putative membrane protein
MTQQWKHVATASCAALACATLAVFAAAAPQPNSAKTTTKTKTASARRSDSEFAKIAAEGGIAEVELGELAEVKASNKAVENLSERLVQDHTKADDNLKTIASKDNIELPSKLSAKDQATYVRLSQLTGTAFDQAYAKEMVKDHNADIAEFRREADDGKDATIKSFASETLPTLEDHLKQASQTLQTVEPTTTAQSKKRTS